MKDGRTHLAHKAEHAVDMETGAIVAVTLQGADVGDTTTIIETAIAAAEQVEDAQANGDDRQSLEEIVGDKGYHSNQTLIDLDAVGIRSYVSEPDRGRRDWSKDPEARAPVYGNRRRMRGRRGRRLMRQRGERIEAVNLSTAITGILSPGGGRLQRPFEPCDVLHSSPPIEAGFKTSQETGETRCHSASLPGEAIGKQDALGNPPAFVSLFPRVPVDGNDGDRLAVHKLLLGRDPITGDALASQPTTRTANEWNSVICRLVGDQRHVFCDSTIG